MRFNILFRTVIVFASIALLVDHLNSKEPPSLLFRNGLGEKMEMWLYVQSPKGWSEPVMTLDVSETRKVRFPYDTAYYVVLVDGQFRKDRLGWFPFYNDATNQGSDSRVIELSALYRPKTIYQQETRTRTVQVTKTRQETRTKTVMIFDDATKRYVEREVSYTVNVPYTELTDVPYTVSVPAVIQERVPQLRVIDASGATRVLTPLERGEIPSIPGEEDAAQNKTKTDNRARLGIQFKMCPSGVHVLAVSPGSPASKCVNVQNGVSSAIEVDDHIVTVNGLRPQSEAEMQRLVEKSGSVIQLSVVDVRTGNVLQLQTTLE